MTPSGGATPTNAPGWASPFGAYLYSYATTVEEARSEADHVARLLGLTAPPQEGLDRWVALPTGWMPLDGIDAREREDHVPYRDWIRAGFLHGCEGDIIDFEAVA